MERKPWHEDDEFWALRARMMFPPSLWERTPVEVDGILTLLGVDEGAAILDLGCGPGRHSLELARRGFRVTGVDRTRLYLDEARRRAEAEGLAVEFVEEDMRRFVRPATFDAAINMLTAFGYFEDPEDDRRVAGNLCRSLRPGGRLLMDVMGKEVLGRIFRARDWHEVEGGFLLVERSVDRDWTWIRNHEIYLKDDQRIEADMDHRIYSAAELTALLRSCDFARTTTYGDLTGAPYDHVARRLIIVAER